MNQRSTLSTAISETVRDGVVGGAKRLGFWGSILLPAAYLPVLYGTVGDDVLVTLVALVGLNLVCLVLGRDYAQ